MFDFEKLDKTIHEKGRLGIMTLLAARPTWTFGDLKVELKMSDGNLVTHLRTLHQAGYVSVTKEILDRPQTSYALTDARAQGLPGLPLRARADRQNRPGLKKFAAILCDAKFPLTLNPNQL